MAEIVARFEGIRLSDTHYWVEYWKQTDNTDGQWYVIGGASTYLSEAEEEAKQLTKKTNYSTIVLMGSLSEFLARRNGSTASAADEASEEPTVDG